MTFTFGICSSDRKFIGHLRRAIEYCALDEGLTSRYEIFFTGEEFLKFREDNPPPNLLFLDVELRGMDGIELGYKIRDDLENEAIQIIFMADTETYAMRLFNIRPMDFLVKPFRVRAVNHIMQKYIRIFSPNTTFFEYHISKSRHWISESMILYFQGQGKKVQMVTTKGEEKEFYDKISDVAKRLKGKKFSAVHKSYIVNYNCVTEILPQDLVMADGSKVPVSRRYHKKVMEELRERERRLEEFI